MDDNDARTDYFAVIYDCHPAADPIPESINSSLSAGGGGRRRMDALTHQSVHPSFDSSVLCFRFLVVSLKEAHRCIPTLAESFFFFWMAVNSVAINGAERCAGRPVPFRRLVGTIAGMRIALLSAVKRCMSFLNAHQ